jgi:enolase
MPGSILSINAAQRLDSRGNPTVQVTLVTEKGSIILHITPLSKQLGFMKYP